MKQAALCLLIVSVLLQGFRTAGVWLGFKLDQARIVRVLCVARAEAANACQGRCYLAKKLHQAQRQAEGQAAGIRKAASAPWLCQPFAALLPPPAVRPVPAAYGPVRPFGLPAGFAADFFRPPSAA